MIAVCIPTLNESKNIQHLTRLIDESAVSLGLKILIINSDSSSKDKTRELFNSTKTNNNKISLATKRIGKGRNVKNIIEYAEKESEIDYCLFVDGDVQSFTKEWLEKHSKRHSKMIDLVLPQYKRSIYEGNTTNHLAFPILNALTGGQGPRQPIAGDFGLSRKFFSFLNTQNWSESVNQYGVDIFITMNSLFNDFIVEEIQLDKKVHNPSFSKMVSMFEQVATALFESVKDSNLSNKPRIHNLSSKDNNFFSGTNINRQELLQREQEANEIMEFNRINNVGLSKKINFPISNSDEWISCVYQHLSLVNDMPSSSLAKSITPYFLSRVVAYIREVGTSKEAETIINRQADLLISKMR